MEVRKRLLALAAVVVTMTIVTSADSGVVDLTQLLEGADRTRRQLTSCSIPYPTTNPCEYGRTQDRFAISSVSDMFIQCSSDNTMYLTYCPPSQPYFNQYLQDCSTTIGLARSVKSIAAGRTNRQTPTCSFQYPTSNPCLQIGGTQDRFKYQSSPNIFIQCHHNTMYLTICPRNKPYYDESLHDCAASMSTGGSSSGSISQCGLSVDPCTSYNLYTLSQHAFACPSNPTGMYLQCDGVGAYHFITCPTNEVFSASSQSCVVSHVQSPNTIVVTGYAYPCTAQSIASQHFLHAYEGNTQLYIQCNEWGAGYLRSCQPGYFNPLSSTCVDGPIVGRK